MGKLIEKIMSEAAEYHGKASEIDIYGMGSWSTSKPSIYILIHWIQLNRYLIWIYRKKSPIPYTYHTEADSESITTITPTSTTTSTINPTTATTTRLLTATEESVAHWYNKQFILFKSLKKKLWHCFSTRRFGSRKSLLHNLNIIRDATNYMYIQTRYGLLENLNPAVPLLYYCPIYISYSLIFIFGLNLAIILL